MIKRRKKSGDNKQKKIPPLVILVLVVLFAVTVILVLQKYDINRYLRTSVDIYGESNVLAGDWGGGIDMPNVGGSVLAETETCSAPTLINCLTPTSTSIPIYSTEPTYPTDTGYPYSGTETAGKVAGTDTGTCPSPSVMCYSEFIDAPMAHNYWFDIETQKRKTSIGDTDVKKILERICSGTPKISGCEGVEGNAALGCANTEYKDGVFGAPTIELAGLMSKIERAQNVFKYGINPEGAYVKSGGPEFQEFYTGSNVYPAPLVDPNFPAEEDKIELIEWTMSYKLSSQNINNLKEYHPGLAGVAMRTIKAVEEHEDHHLSIWREHSYGLMGVINFFESLARTDYDTPEEANANVPHDIKNKFTSDWGEIDAKIEQGHLDFDATYDGKWAKLPIDGLENISCPEMEDYIVNVSFMANPGGKAEMRDASVTDSVAFTMISTGQWRDRSFLMGTMVSLKAIPDKNQVFKEWKKNLLYCGCENQGANCTISAYGINDCIAVFREAGTDSGSPTP